MACMSGTGRLLVSYCLLQWSCCSPAVAQYSGSGSEDSGNQKSTILPELSIPPIPYYIYIPALVVLLVVIGLACAGWIGCCCLCYMRSKNMKIINTKKKVEDGRVEHTDMYRNSQSQPREDVRADSNHPPPTASATSALNNYSETEPSSNSLPGTLIASGKHAVSPPASTVPLRGKRKTATHQGSLVREERDGEQLGERVNEQSLLEVLTPGEEPSSTVQVQSSIVQPTDQETSPSQRSSIGQGDTFESLERVRTTIQPHDSQQSKNGTTPTAIEQTSV